MEASLRLSLRKQTTFCDATGSFVASLLSSFVTHSFLPQRGGEMNA